MSWQATLPLSSLAGTAIGAELDEEAFRPRPWVRTKEVTARRVVRRCASPSLPAGLEITPYTGCEFACSYQLEEPSRRIFDLAPERDGVCEVRVLKGAAAALGSQLRRVGLRGRSFILGAVADPYQPAEAHYRLTRSLLEEFRETEGMEICIATKSPLILRDLDLLAELDARHAVTVHVLIPTADPFLAKRLERHAPTPRARFQAVAELAREGIEAHVLCTPLFPGVNDSATALRPLLEQAREAGATDVAARILHLSSSERGRFFSWMERELPALIGRYRRLYGWRETLADSQRELVEGPFRQLRLAYGFPRGLSGRG